MTTHRFFVDEALFDLDREEIILPDEISHQIKKVLRLSDGDRIILCDGARNEYIAAISFANNTVIAKIIGEQKNENEPEIDLTLYQSLIPREKFEDVLTKGTELGVSKFIPLETAFCQIHPRDIDEKKLSRWQKIIQEAAEQSERGIIPQIQKSMKFESAIDLAIKHSQVLIAWEGEDKAKKLKIEDIKTPISLFIGPEGGFKESEIEFAKKKGAITISLGKRILRSETAGIVASAKILIS